MARARLDGDTLRDQLTLLANQQKVLHKETSGWDKAKTVGEKELAKLATLHIQARQKVLSTDIEQGSAQMVDNFVTWTPLDLDPSKGALGKSQTQAFQVATTARTFSTKASIDAQVAKAKEEALTLRGKLKKFDETLPAAVAENPAHDRLAVHVANRLAESSKLTTQTSGWVHKADKLAAGEFHLAAEVDQHRLTTDTAELARKLENLESEFAGMPEEITDLCGDLNLILSDMLMEELSTSQVAFQQNQLKKAADLQQTAVNNFAKAEKILDEIMDKVIKELDAQPVGKPNLDGVEPKTLEELLAMLEDEAKALEALGIPCCRPSNLMIEKDWMSPGKPMGGGGGQLAGAMGQSAAGAQRAAQMQKAFQKAAQKILEEANRTADAKDVKNKRSIRWNTLASQLEDRLKQGRGRIPPEQYRKAIERYFELLSQESRSSSKQDQ